MIVERYSIDKTIVNIDDSSFILVTEDEKECRVSIFDNLLTSLIQKVNNNE